MNLISFDVFRTLGLPDIQVIKPEHFFQHKDAIRSADWVLFPQYWQLNALIYGLNARVFRAKPAIASVTTRWK